MTGRRNFSELKAKMSPERLKRIEGLAKDMREEMDLAQIRSAMKMSQATLAEALHVEQPAIAKIERRTDMYVSTLRRFIEAMGGELELTARFQDRSVRIASFEEIRSRGERETAIADVKAGS
jgi:transcriptional regulator with XRE-family HTH domain